MNIHTKFSILNWLDVSRFSSPAKPCDLLLHLPFLSNCALNVYTSIDFRW